jgi:hypothetical protein
MRFLVLSAALTFCLAGAACGGDDDGGNGSGNDGGNGSGDDGGNGSGDGGGGGGGGVDCVEDGPECNNCVDDDEDGFIDGADIQCSGPLDDREDSFATGIPGDNVDPVLQDCFFDGDSGEGNDGCVRPTCCLTEGETADCPPPGPADDCSVSNMCIEICGEATPPGCDCFGCCTLCNGETCFDVAIGLANDDCTIDNLDDEEACPRCIKDEDCTGGECEGDDCVLCPGQTEEDLPDSCEGNDCPGGETPCESSSDCGGDEYCSTGCCVNVVE